MTVLAYILIGLAAGAVGAVLGIGGGIIYVPLMVTVFSFQQHMAQGTSLAVMVPSMLVAAVIHARAGRVDWKLAITLGAGAILGGLGGARLALWLDAVVLRRMFAVAMVLMSARMLYQTQKRARQDRRQARETAVEG
jgi:uncharacterized membrane protein YfcA